MKKTVIFILSVFLILSIIACSNVVSPSGSSDRSSSKSEAPAMGAGDPDITDQEPGGNAAVSAQYEVGDIILADGSSIKESDFTVIDSGNVPIAVIAGFQEDGTAFGIGVHRSDTPLQWAEDEANYPAFHFVNTYAVKYELTGAMASGWYMPSIAELCDIYQNRKEINNSLQHIYELDPQASMDGLDTNWYWSSSQADSRADYAWFVHYYNGYAGECPKNFTNVHVLAVRIF